MMKEWDMSQANSVTSMAVNVESMLSFTFEIEAIRFHNEESHWGVFECDLKKEEKLVTVTGVLRDAHVGMVFCGKGGWKTHNVFGKQFVLHSYQHVEPVGDKAMIAFLHQVIFKDIAGLGEKTAQKVVKAFADKTSDILSHHPERLSEIKGLSKKRISEIKKQWQLHLASKDIILLLSGHGMSMQKIHKLLTVLPNDALLAIRKRPYALVGLVSGLGFKTVDNLALSLGIDPLSLQRMQAGILHLLKYAKDFYGNCFVPKDRLLAKLPGLLGCSEEHVVEHMDVACQDLAKDQLMVMVKEDGKSLKQSYYHSFPAVTLCYLSVSFHLESGVAQMLADLTARSKKAILASEVDEWLAGLEASSKETLTATQKRAVFYALREPIFILTGGAGVGKTTTLKAILYAASQLKLEVALASPTGRAAQRMKEVTSNNAKTLHRLLEWSPMENSFARNAQRVLECDMVVVDEGSMIDLYLAKALLAALSPRTQLIIIGDPHQLPSVGMGCFLEDCILSGAIVHLTLKDIFRQAAFSPIISTAKAIQQCRLPEVFSQSLPTSMLPVDLSVDSCTFISADSHIDIKEMMLTSIRQRFAHLDPLRDIQILCPVNKGDLGCDSLNRSLQPLLCPRAEKKASTRVTSHNEAISFAVGDKVIQTVNNYQLGVFNGDIGFVQDVSYNKSQKIIAMDVAFAHSGERSVHYDKDSIKDLKLAYAITIHKSQGSEFHTVIIPLSSSHHMMLGKNLLYTAITRAKHHVLMIGMAHAVDASLKKPALPPRFTRLATLLKRIHLPKAQDKLLVNSPEGEDNGKNH